MQIEQCNLPTGLALFGNKVGNFPAGVQQGFNTLVAMLPEGLTRDYYGVSWMEGVQVIYYAMAAEQYVGEAGTYKVEQKISVEKGHYLTIAITGWLSKTACIKDAFHLLMHDARVATGAKCLEWYKSDQEMWCMMKAKE